MESSLIVPAPILSPVFPEGLGSLCPFAASRETPIFGSLPSPRPFPPLSKSFRTRLLRPAFLCGINKRPYSPLCKSFVFNMVTKLSQNPPLSNFFRFNHLQTSSPVTTSVFYHLRETTNVPQKRPNVFYHLQTVTPVSTCLFYHLIKKGGWGVGNPHFVPNWSRAMCLMGQIARQRGGIVQDVASAHSVMQRLVQARRGYAGRTGGQ
jgi:hypothetical protein